MSIIFIRDILMGLYPWLNGKRIIAYFLLQGDLIVLLLFVILILI